MHIVLGLIGLATAAYFLIIRARNGAEMATELLDVADDVRAAARRWGFRRRQARHPVDEVDDARLALAGVGSAFIALDDLPTADARTRLSASLSRHLDLNAKDAHELVILGQWLVEQSGGPTSALPRLARQQFRLSGSTHFEPLMAVLGDTLSGTLSTRQTEALDDLKRAFRIT